VAGLEIFLEVFMSNNDKKNPEEEQGVQNPALSRRDFLKGAAAGAMGVAVAGALAACENTVTETKWLDKPLDADEAGKKWAFETPPAPITNISSTVSADIVVVGSGMAGLTTARAALEKNPNLKVLVVSGSAGPISRGGSNSSVYSKVMQNAGISSRPLSFWAEYFNREQLAGSYRVDQKKWSKFFTESEEAMDWLIDIASANNVEVTLERDNYDATLGEVLVAHNFSGAAGSGAAAGQQSIVDALAAEIINTANYPNAQIIYLTAARQLIRGTDNKTGRVSGVIAEEINPADGAGTGTYIKYNASKAVVLATGDFSGDRDMVAKYCPWVLPLISAPLFPDPPNIYDKSFALGSGLYKGDGQKMGLWVGAAWQHVQPAAPMLQGSLPSVSSASYQPLGEHQGLVVNALGERYYNEDISAPYASVLLANQPGRLSVSIWTDSFYDKITSVAGRTFRTFGEQYYPNAPAPKTRDEMLAAWNAEPGAYGGPYNATSLTDLSEKLVAAFAGPQFGNNGGISPETGGLTAPQLRAKLLATIQHYNDLADNGEDTDFLKDSSLLQKIGIDADGAVTDGTNIHYEINYVQYMTMVGGLRTDDKMRVCDESDTPIPGLFNVGVMVGDVFANTYNFAIPGHSYGGNCLTFGRRLGYDLAEDKV
jgi:succinate dehydrogenase/fumarate reductase flavoprotein subunit